MAGADDPDKEKARAPGSGVRASGCSAGALASVRRPKILPDSYGSSYGS